VDELCYFLTGPCSCRVKGMHPGFDLLMTANWDEAIRYYPESAKTLVPGGGEFLIGGTNELTFPKPALPKRVSRPAEEPVQEEPVTRGSRMPLIVAVAALVVLAVIGRLLMKRT